MSVKIKVSYNTDEELAGIARLLSPVLGEKKISRNKAGRYRKAYIEIDGGRLERLERSEKIRNAPGAVKPDI